MNKKDKYYIDILLIINDIYKLNNKNLDLTLKDIMELHSKNMNEFDFKETWLKMFKYITSLYLYFDKKIKDIKEFEKDLMIKIGIDNNSHINLINIYKNIYHDDIIDLDVLLLIIIPSLTIKFSNRIEIIDFNINTTFNKRILKILDKDINNEDCPICFEKIKKNMIISNCCCFKSCIRCFQLNNYKCPICKDEKPIIINF